MTSHARLPVRVEDRGASVVLDDRHWPVIFSTWFGEPTVALIDKYFEAHEANLTRAKNEKTQFVLVTDTFATARPSPAARKRIADLTEARLERIVPATLKSFIVIENPLIRGVV